MNTVLLWSHMNLIRVEPRAGLSGGMVRLVCLATYHSNCPVRKTGESIAYVPPKFKDADGKTCEGNEAWEKGLKKLSDLGLLAIPNRPFSDKTVRIIAGKNPPGGDYRKPLTESERKLLRKVVPGLSIRAVDSMPELSDPRLELFLREYYHMGDSRIRTLTWAQLFDACKKYLATRQKEQDGQSRNDNDREIDSETREQAWRDEAPEYIPNAGALRMAGGKISMPTLSKHLRKQGNTIRWMRNKEIRRSKVQAQDFMQYIRNLKSADEFSETVFEQRERQKEIDSHKRTMGE